MDRDGVGHAIEVSAGRISRIGNIVDFVQLTQASLIHEIVNVQSPRLDSKYRLANVYKRLDRRQAKSPSRHVMVTQNK